MDRNQLTMKHFETLYLLYQFKGNEVDYEKAWRFWKNNQIVYNIKKYPQNRSWNGLQNKHEHFILWYVIIEKSMHVLTTAVKTNITIYHFQCSSGIEGCYKSFYPYFNQIQTVIFITFSIYLSLNGYI